MIISLSFSSFSVIWISLKKFVASHAILKSCVSQTIDKLLLPTNFQSSFHLSYAVYFYLLQLLMYKSQYLIIANHSTLKASISISSRSFRLLPKIAYLRFILVVNWASFWIYHRIGSHDPELIGLGSYNLELNCLNTSFDSEKVSFFYRTVGILEVRDEIVLQEITFDPIDGVCKREYMNFRQYRNLNC